MIIKSKYVLYSFASLYGILGSNLLFMVYKMSGDFFNSVNFIVHSEVLRFVFSDWIISITFGMIFTAAAFGVYFAFKNVGVAWAATYSLIGTVVFGEICLSSVYLIQSDHNIDSSLQRMRAISRTTNDTAKANEWHLFQRNMKCCGVLEPNEYLAPPNSNGSYPRSCCVQEKHTITNCTDDNVYKIGCYSKLMFNFQAKNQLVVWSSIVFNVFTLLALYWLRHSGLFVVEIGANAIVVELCDNAKY